MDNKGRHTALALALVCLLGGGGSALSQSGPEAGGAVHAGTQLPEEAPDTVSTPDPDPAFLPDTLSGPKTIDWSNAPKDSAALRFLLAPDNPALIDSASNVILDSAQVLLPFFEKLRELAAGGDRTVVILHVGDSHIQAGFLPGRLRMWFQRYFGNAGRGLVAPLRLAGTNEPSDYAITSGNRWVCSRCRMTPSEFPVGLTGMVAASPDSVVRFTIGARNPFSLIRAFHHPQAPALYEPDSLSTSIRCPLDDSPYASRIVLDREVHQVTLTAPITHPDYNTPVFYGFSLENGRPGVLYHSVGINGVTFEHLNRNEGMIAQSGVLHPDLIVVSLGTNDSWGSNYVENHVNTQIERFFTQLRSTHPNVPVLLTTPMEVYRRQYIRGRRTLAPNQHTPNTVALIRQAAQTHGAALWDFYRAAGGEGANANWLAHRLMQRDRVHFTQTGYEFQADMLFAALMAAYRQTSDGYGVELP